MAKYNIYHGDFRCQICGALVNSLRSYPDTKELTWMCQDKHLSKVSLNTKKSKKDFAD